MNFTIFFDKNYLNKGLILIKSLNKHCENFNIYVLCLDSYVENFFNERQFEFSQVHTFKLCQLEEYFPELINVRKNRSTIEFYFTLSPFIPLFLLKTENLKHICSLDADIKFYASPKQIFEYLNEYSIIITPHKFSLENQRKEKYGLYNVSFQIFKNDEIGLECLENWKKQCYDYCKDEYDVEFNRYADQKYLDSWGNIFVGKIKILDDCQTGLAVWNINNYKLTFKGNNFYSNNKPLIFYHFHEFKILNSLIAFNGFNSYHVISNKTICKIYFDYWLSLKKITKKLKLERVRHIRYNLNGLNTYYLLKREKTFFIYTPFGFIINSKGNNLILFFTKIIQVLYGKISKARNSSR